MMAKAARSAHDLLVVVAFGALAAGVVPAYFLWSDARGAEEPTPVAAVALAVGGVLVWLLLLAVARAVEDRRQG